MKVLCSINEKILGLRRTLFKTPARASLSSVMIYTVIFLVTAGAFYIPYQKQYGIIAGADGIDMYYPLMMNFRSVMREFFAGIAEGKLQYPIINYDYCFGSDNYITTFNFLPFLPFYILSVFVSESGIPLFFTIGLVLLQYLSGLSFIYMCKYFGRDMLWSGVFAMGYSFSGNVLKSAAYNPQFFYMLIAFPLMVVGLDRIINRKGWKALLFGVILTGSSSFTFLVYTLPFLGVFALLRVWFLKKKKFFINLLKDFLLCMGVIITGCMICAVTMLPTLYLLLHSVRESGVESINIAHLLTPYFDRVSLMYIPLSSVGVFAFVMPAALAALTTISAKTELRVYMIAMSILMLFPLFSYGVNGFMYDGYNRWAFIVSLLISYIAVAGMEQIPRFDRYDASLFFLSALIYSVILTLEYEWISALLVTVWIVLMMIPPFRRLVIKGTDLAVRKVKGFILWVKRTKDGSKRYLTALVLALMFVPVSAFSLAVVISNRMGWDYLFPGVLTAVSALLIYKRKQLKAILLSALILIYAVSAPMAYVRKGEKNDLELLTMDSIHSYVASNTEPGDTCARVENMDTAHVDKISGLTEKQYDDMIYDADAMSEKNARDIPVIGNYILNDSLVYGVPTVKQFNNMIDSDLLNFFDRIGMTGEGYISQVNMQSFADREPLYSLFSVDTLFTFKNAPPIYGTVLSDSTVADDYEYLIYHNDYSFPTGVTYDTYMSREDYEQLSEAYLPFAMMESAYIDGYDGETSQLHGSRDEQSECSITVDSEFYKTNEKGVDYYANTVTIENDVSDCFLYLSFSGVEVKSMPIFYFVTPLVYMDNDTGRISAFSNDLSAWPWKRIADHYCIALGYTDKDIDVLKFVSEFSYDDMKVNAVPAEWFRESYEARCEEKLENVVRESDRLSGDITVSGEKLLSVSYLANDGWSVYVDGEERPLCSVNELFLGVMLEDGEHHVEFRYCTPWLPEGALVTAAGIVLFIAAEIVLRKSKRSAAKAGGSEQ